MRGKPVLDYVKRYRDRHGKLRHYFRRPGCKEVPLPGLYGSSEFMAAYQAALDGISPPCEIGADRYKPGSVSALITAYLDCAPFKALAAETRRTRRNILENFAKAHGELPIFNSKRIMLLTREHVQRLVNKKAETPFAQRNFLNTLRTMFQWAMREGDDPTLGVKRITVKTTGYQTWSEDHIARLEATHPIGTNARLAFALVLYTGLRRSDVVRLGPKHIHQGVLIIEQNKTEGGEEAPLEIPLHPKLREIIDATPMIGVKTFLVTHFGKPYTAPGFGNWFRELCNAAGCVDISAHGERKATARRLAEIGCTAKEIASVTGHARSARCNATPRRPTASAWRARRSRSSSRVDGEQSKCLTRVSG